MGPWALNAMTAKARTNVSRLLVEGVWDVLVGVGDGVGVGRAVEVAPGAFGEFGVGVVIPVESSRGAGLVHWLFNEHPLTPQKSFAPPTPPQKQLSFVKDAPVRVVVALSVLTR